MIAERLLRMEVMLLALLYVALELAYERHEFRNVTTLYVGGVEREGAGHAWLAHEHGAQKARHARAQDGLLGHRRAIDTRAIVKGVLYQRALLQSQQNHRDGLPRRRSLCADVLVDCG